MTASSDESRPEPAAYETIAAVSRAETKVQRSRFLAEAAPAVTIVEAKAFVADVAGRYHDCRHVCFAWRGGHGSSLQEVRSDGGEPAGTAGEPILAALRAAALSDCVAVVARYFGGVKLGTGGLARAYREAAALALAAAPRRVIQLGGEFSLRFAYRLQKTVAAVVKRHGGRPVSEDYGQEVSWRIWLPESAWRACRDELVSATAGEVSLKKAPAAGPEP